MDIYILLLLFLASVLGSAVNAVAGGGTFFTFPTLIFAGVPILRANATSTVALWPGILASVISYRDKLNIDKKLLWGFCIISIIGSVTGTWLLLITPSDTLKSLLPYLLLTATLILVFKVRLAKSRLSKSLVANRYALLLVQFIIAVYGGYFGGGIGILMLATFNLMGFTDMLQMNALKTLLAGIINGAAVLLFIFTKQVVWHVALVMIIGGLIGGAGGAYIGKMIPQKILSAFVVAVGFLLTIYFFIKS